MWISIKAFIGKYAVTLGIAVVALLIAHNAIISFIGQQAIKERNETEKVYLQVNGLIDRHSTLVNLMDLGLRGYHMIPDEKFIDPYNIAMEQYEDNFDTLEVAMRAVHYPHLDSIAYVKQHVSNYADLVGRGIDYIRKGQSEEAVALFSSDPGYTLWKNSFPILEDIKGYVSQLNEESKANYEFMAAYSTIAQLITLILGIPMLAIVLLRLVRYESRILGLFGELKKSQNDYIFKDKKANDKSSLDKGLIIQQIIANLKKASQFIQDISKGNLSAEWDGMDEELRKENKGTIAGELMEMRDQLKTVKEEADTRQWITEGVAAFADLIRANKNDFDKLNKEIISFVVKYTESNQGGLYLLNEKDKEDPYLELVSCYAYDRHKLLEKRIDIGQGLLGQIYLEGEITRYNDIPADYVNITSGLGHALPRNLILVPIMLDNKAQGVLELASFQEFKEEHMELLTRISDSLASEIFSIKSNQLTQLLLEQSKENEETMRSQEEEMRQNMEELEATQEEQERQRKELEEKIAELESQLNTTA